MAGEIRPGGESLPVETVAMNRILSELKLKRNEAGTISYVQDVNASVRVVCRRCATARAAGILLQSVEDCIRRHSLLFLRMDQHKRQDNLFSEACENAIFQMETAGLLADPKVAERIRRAISRLKIELGLQQRMPEKSFNFLRGVLSKSDRHKGSKDHRPGPVRVSNDQAEAAHVTIETAQVLTVSSSVTVTELRSVSGQLDCFIDTNIATLEKPVKDGVHKQVMKSVSPLLAIAQSDKQAWAKKIADMLGKVGLSIGSNAQGPAATAPYVFSSPPVSPPSVTDVPRQTRFFDIKGKPVKPIHSGTVVQNVLEHDNPLAFLQNDLRLMADRFTSCARESIGKKSKIDWTGANTILQAGGKNVIEPKDHLQFLINELRNLAAGELDRAGLILEYLKALDAKNLNWLVFNLFSIPGNPVSGLPIFHNKSRGTLFEALFCAGSDRPECASFFRDLRKAFLMGVAPLGRASQVNATGIHDESDAVCATVDQLLRGFDSKHDDIARADSAKQIFQKRIKAFDDFRTRCEKNTSTACVSKQEFESVFGGMLLVLQARLGCEETEYHRKAVESTSQQGAKKSTSQMESEKDRFELTRLREKQKQLIKLQYEAVVRNLKNSKEEEKTKTARHLRNSGHDPVIRFHTPQRKTARRVPVLHFDNNLQTNGQHHNTAFVTDILIGQGFVFDRLRAWYTTGCTQKLTIAADEMQKLVGEFTSRVQLPTPFPDRFARDAILLALMDIMRGAHSSLAMALPSVALSVEENEGSFLLSIS